MVRRCLVGFALFALVLLGGCGPAKPISVSGTVNLDGKALDDGSVILVDEKGGAPTTIPVKNGKFEGQTLAGKKKVEIRAFRLGKPTKMGDVEIPAPQVNYLPERFNTDSTMKAEVTTSGINPSTFDVQSR